MQGDWKWYARGDRSSILLREEKKKVLALSSVRVENGFKCQFFYTAENFSFLWVTEEPSFALETFEKINLWHDFMWFLKLLVKEQFSEH